MAIARGPLPTKTLRLVSTALFGGAALFGLVAVAMLATGQPTSFAIMFACAALIDLAVAFVFKTKADRAEGAQI